MKPTTKIGIIWVLFAIRIALPSDTEAQTVFACTLERAESETMVGTCVSPDRELSISLDRTDDESDVKWIGALSSGENDIYFEIASYEYHDGPKLIAKYFAWYPLTEYSENPNSLTIAWDQDHEAPPSEMDAEILWYASTLISDEAKWDRKDDRNCENDTGKLSLYCALARSTEKYMGSYQHRQPAMQAVRFVIQDRWRDRYSSHRLMDFNNNPETTLSDIKMLFELSTARLRLGGE